MPLNLANANATIDTTQNLKGQGFTPVQLQVLVLIVPSQQELDASEVIDAVYYTEAESVAQ